MQGGGEFQYLYLWIIIQIQHQPLLTGLTSLATAKAAVARCHELWSEFDATFANLYFLEIPELGRRFSQTALPKRIIRFRTFRNLLYGVPII